MKMRILLFGISNIGKTSIGKSLAQKLSYDFYDLDEEIKKIYDVTLEGFQDLFPNDYKRHQIRCDIVQQLIDRSKNSVISVSVLNYKEQLDPVLKSKDILPIELRDKPENVFDRLVFSDEFDVIYKDDDYKNEHKDHYIYEIISDLYYYSHIYKDIIAKYFINNKSIDTAADDLYTLIKNNQPITIKFHYDEMIEDIKKCKDDIVCYYNIITHEKFFLDRSNPDKEIETDVAINYMIYVQLPTLKDFNSAKTFKKFIKTIDNQSYVNKLKKHLNTDFLDVVKELDLLDKWNNFKEKYQRKFIETWCDKNHVEVD